MGRTLVSCVVVGLMLAGCGAFNVLDKKIDYRSATRTQPLEVPPDLSAPIYDDRFQIKGDAPGSATYSAYGRDREGLPRAGQSKLLPAVDKARIERSGTQRWLVVQGEPEPIWNTVREFWIELGFVIANEQPQLGLLETAWAENRAKIPDDLIRRTIGWIFDFAYSTNERDKFRARIERGTEAGTTEIYISHRGMVEVASQTNSTGPASFVWQPRPADPELEAEMLRRLMIRIGLPAEKAQTVVAAATAVSPSSPERARLEKANDGITRLQVDDSFDRSWRRVGLALDRIGFTVVDRDRSQGLYYVRYADPDADPKKQEQSFFDKLAFWRSPESKQEQYRIAVTEAGSKSLVAVQSREGAAEKSATADRILNLLLAQLK